MKNWTGHLGRWLAAVGLLGAGSAPGAATLPEGGVVHGSFEIVVGVRRISAGSFPNTSGNPFARREVSEFQLRWKGQPVATADGNRRFWRVLRLAGAPRPALLLVTTGFVLASENAAGQLQLQSLSSPGSQTAELQWLDARQGQPGPTQRYGIEAVDDLQAGTLLQGGRWLRLGAGRVMDVATLSLFAVEPWVPMLPGVPVTAISREGDDARAFSPSRGQYVLLAGGPDYSREDRRHVDGLLVVDIASGQATELRMQRRRFRFAEPTDVDAAWIHHHFTWQRDGSGRERLQPREGFAPWPWRARLIQELPGVWSLRLPRIDGRFLAVLRGLAEAQAGSAAVDTSQPWGAGFNITLTGCALQARVFGADSSDPTESRIAVWPDSGSTGHHRPPSAACEPALRQLASAVDAELATGRHDAWLRLD